MRIIAFSGKKQSGKTTATNFLCRKLYSHTSVYVLNFGDSVKRVVLELFVPYEWSWMVEDLDDNKDKVLPLGKTVRETLQWFGTDVCRKEDENCWVNTYKVQLREHKILEGLSSAEESTALIVTSDVRFPNEVKCIQDLDGHVIRLLRAPFPEDKHESETALDEMEKSLSKPEYRGDSGGIFDRQINGRCFDAIIDNRDMTIAEQNEAVWKLVNERGWI